MLIGGTLNVNNVPVIGKSGYMVVTNDHGKLWYYGLYKTVDRAKEVVAEDGDKFIIKVDAEEKDHVSNG